MPLFSERYGYVKPSDVFITEGIDDNLENALCSCFDDLSSDLEANRYKYGTYSYFELNQYVWVYFLNGRKSKCPSKEVITGYIKGYDDWFLKFDIIETVIQCLSQWNVERRQYGTIIKKFIDNVNASFSRLHYGYSIIDGHIVEVVSKEEVSEIEKCIDCGDPGIQQHIQNALSLYAKRPEGDYRNSIKESISAVEVLCREKTGEGSLGAALSKLEGNGIVIQPMLKGAFEKLYHYTNQPDTGIRHALMDREGKYTPTADEAYFMLVSCSAFINYMQRKMSNI